MKVQSLLLVAIVVSSAGSSAFGQGYHTRDGAVKGGVLGAVAGGIIGHQNDEATEGIIIGSAIGALTGGLIGNDVDQQHQRRRYYAQQRVYQQQQARRAVSMVDIVNMSRNGISEPLIVNHVRTNGVQHELTTQDIIELTRNGVSENVILAMQQSPIGGATRTVVEVPVPRQPQVIVHREYHVAPRPHRYVYRSYGPTWRPRRY